MMLACSVLFDSATPWTVARQAPLSVGFSRQEFWSGLPFPTPGDLSNPGIEPESPASPALAGRSFITEPPGKPISLVLPYNVPLKYKLFYFLNLFVLYLRIISNYRTIQFKKI